MTDSAPSYRAAIVGLGFVGAGDQVSGDAIGGQQVSALDGTHVDALRKHPRIGLVAGSSRDAGRRERFAQRTGVKTYPDWRAMIDAERPDVASVATYSPSHAEITIGCAERGVRAIYCEKPIATRLVDAERMVAACEKAGALLVVNHNRRFNLHHRRLRDRIGRGALGELTSGSLRWGNGRLGNVGTHLIDAVCMLTGRTVEAVSGTLDRSAKVDCRGPGFHDPGGWGLMRLAGGLIVTVDAANHGTGGGHVILYGTRGRAIVLGDAVTLEFSDGHSEYWPGQGKETTSMDRTVAEIVEWLDRRSPISHPALEAMQVLEAIVAFHVSDARHAAWVELPLAGADREREVRSG